MLQFVFILMIHVTDIACRNIAIMDEQLNWKEKETETDPNFQWKMSESPVLRWSVHAVSAFSASWLTLNKQADEGANLETVNNL